MQWSGDGWIVSKSSGWKDINEDFPEDIDKARKIVCDGNLIHERFRDLCNKLWDIIYNKKNMNPMEPLPEEDVTLMKNAVIKELKKEVSSPEFLNQALSEWVGLGQMW